MAELKLYSATYIPVVLNQVLYFIKQIGMERFYKNKAENPRRHKNGFQEKVPLYEMCMSYTFLHTICENHTNFRQRKFLICIFADRWQHCNFTSHHCGNILSQLIFSRNFEREKLYLLFIVKCFL